MDPLVPLLGIVGLGLLVALLVVSSRATAVRNELAREQFSSLRSSQALADKQKELDQVRGEISALQERANAGDITIAEFKRSEASLGNIQDRLKQAEADLGKVQEVLRQAESLLEEKEIVIFPRQFPEETSEALKERMAAVRARQAEIRRKGQVVIRFGAAAQERLSVEERVRLKSLVRLARLALEGAADTLLDQVRASNQERLEVQFSAVVSNLNRLLEPWGLEIGKNYQATVRQSLELMTEYKQQVDKEREEQRALREQMREEAAAQREAERAQREAENEERRAERELLKAQEAAAKATLEERDRWLDKVRELEAALNEAHASKDRAIAMAQLTKAGHVYIISNIGSFGDDVFKVGLTRRLDPEDRVAELGDASVPFPFDIHGMISSKDAPALESALHAALESYRMNLVNERKEFFQVAFPILRAEVERQGGGLQLTAVAEAAEYRQSMSIRQGLKKVSVDYEEEQGAEDPEDIAHEENTRPDGK